MTTTLRITIDAFDIVLQLWRRCEGVGVNESDTRERIAKYLERNPGQSFVAQRAGDSRIVGAVLGGNDGRRGYLHHLAVDESCRKAGRMLVNACLAELAKMDIARCNVFVYADNDAGKAGGASGSACATTCG